MSVSCQHKKPSGTVWIWPVNFSRLLLSFSEWMKRIQQDFRYVEKINLNKATCTAKVILSIWCREKRPRGRAFVRLFTVPYFPIRPSRLSALPWWRRASGFIGGSGREVTLRAESPSIFLENVLKMKESLLSVICHTVISSLQLAFQEARPSSNASIRLVIRL